MFCKKKENKKLYYDGPINVGDILILSHNPDALREKMRTVKVIELSKQNKSVLILHPYSTTIKLPIYDKDKKSVINYQDIMMPYTDTEWIKIEALRELIWDKASNDNFVNEQKESAKLVDDFLARQKQLQNL